MAEPISIQQLKDASEDAISLAEFINKPENAMIPRRLASDIHSLQYYLEYMKSFAQRSYETYDEMVTNTSNLSENVSVFVTNDLDSSKNGIYTYNGTEFVKGEYQPENVAKEFVEAKLGGLEVFDGKVSAQDISVVSMSTDSTARTQLDKNRESVSAMDFFTQEELTQYLLNSSTFDAYRPLQEFLNYITNNDVGTAYWTGEFSTSSGLVLGNSVANGSKTKKVSGSPRLKALNSIDTMLTFHPNTGFEFDGIIYCTGTGSTKFDSRTCRTGVKVGDLRANRSNFTGFIFQSFWEWGLEFGELTTLNFMGDIRASDCGSGYKDSRYSLMGNILSSTNSGSSGSPSQYSTLTVDVLPPIESTSYATQIVIDGKVYYVNSVDRDNSTIQIFPWVAPTLTSTEFRYKFGGAVGLLGADAGVVGFRRIDAVRCGTALSMGALYGCTVERLCAQFCGNGLDIGKRPDGALRGFNIGLMYCENNDFDIIRVTRAIVGGTIAATQAVNKSKITDCVNARSSSGNLSLLYSPLNTISYNEMGVALEKFKQPDNGYDSAGTIPLDVTTSSNELILRRDSGTVAIADINTDYNRLFGYDSTRLTIIGKYNSAPSGKFTFLPPTGWTVNGGDSSEFLGFSEPATFLLYANITGKDVTVVTSSKLAKAAKLDFEPISLEAGASETRVLTATGFTTADVVVSSINRDRKGVLFHTYVSANDTITVIMQNTSDSLYSVPRSTLRVNAL